MNMLILSCGTRNKIVQYFKKAFTGIGDVIATDCSELAPALYEADRHYIVPRITEDGYLDRILQLCKEERIKGVLSLIDPELSLLAVNEQRFAEIGVTVIGSSYALCERALDKMAMYQWLSEHGYHCAKSYKDKEQFYLDIEKGTIDYPVFVKPIRGSASISINIANDKETVELLFAHDNNLMIQEYLSGQEIGVDCYIDMISGDLVAVFMKKKLLMRAGETDKAVSFKDEKLLMLIEQFVQESGWKGQIDIDVFEVNEEYYISEVNPRFGGGYPHAYECGCDHMKLIVNNLERKASEKHIGESAAGNFIMKYSELKIIK